MSTNSLHISFLVGALCMSPLLAACLDDQSAPTDEVGDDLMATDHPEDSSDAVARRSPCLLPGLPAPFDATVDLDQLPSNGRLYLRDDYGTTACADHTTRFLRATFSGTWQLGLGITRPTTPEACVGVELTVIVDEKSAVTNRWTRLTHVSYGEFTTAAGCVLPDLRGPSYGTDESRVTARVQSTTCTGQLCATQFGRPFFLVAKP